MEQPIEQRGDGRGVAEQLAPVVDGAVRCEQRRRALVAAHDQLEEVLGGGVRQLAHAEVVDDQQRHGGEVGEIVLAGAVERGVGDLLEQGVGLAIEDAMALLDGGASDGLREMALAGAGRAEEERVFALGDEAAGGELVDRARDSSSC